MSRRWLFCYLEGQSVSYILYFTVWHHFSREVTLFQVTRSTSREYVVHAGSNRATVDQLYGSDMKWESFR